MFSILGIVFAALLVVILGLIFWAVNLYNSLIQLKVRSENAWSDTDVQLKRRYDIIPNLVATVEGYAKHERTTLQSVIEARAKAMGVTDVSQKGQAENFLTGALKSLFAVAESYPQLKANENFLKLQTSLSEIEEVIQSARRYYNAVVRDLNTQLEVFPNNIFANMLNFKKRDFFQLDVPEAERKAPEVKF
ncbi:MAG: LemA family protein [Candidatus Omnitrophota bacterium]|nr:LemA family protein [Candidatus Omnitrophota bacterium]